jgi:hypothetical protein
MPRGRAFFLVILISISALSYWSFDSHIRPAFSSATSGFSQAPTAPVDHIDHNVMGGDGSILLVSAFYPVSKSKHTMGDYSKWLSHFLTPITTPIYFFTTPEMEPIIRKLRGNLPITINTTYLSAFDTPPLEGMREKYEEMRKLDREKSRHSTELYSIWTAKPFFLDEGVKNTKGKFEYAFWTDAGSFRKPHQFTAWPDAQRVKDVWAEGSKQSGTRPEDLFFVPVFEPPHGSMQYWNEAMGPVDNEFSEGSFFGGTAHTIRWWQDIYYAYHDAYLARGVFVGKDQTLMNALLMLNPKRIITVWFLDTSPPRSSDLEKRSIGSEDSHSLAKRAETSSLGLCDDAWYYYQFFLASKAEQRVMAEQWSREWISLWNKFSPWKSYWWTGNAKDLEDEGRGPCRVTRVWSIERLLKERVFGEGWSAPPSTIHS